LLLPGDVLRLIHLSRFALFASPDLVFAAPFYRRVNGLGFILGRSGEPSSIFLVNLER